MLCLIMSCTGRGSVSQSQLTPLSGIVKAVAVIIITTISRLFLIVDAKGFKRGPLRFNRTLVDNDLAFAVSLLDVHSGVKQTSVTAVSMSANDPFRTLGEDRKGRLGL
jgi:hypothetical protein